MYKNDNQANQNDHLSSSSQFGNLELSITEKRLDYISFDLADEMPLSLSLHIFIPTHWYLRVSCHLSFVSLLDSFTIFSRIS